MLYNAAAGLDWSNDANRLSGHALDTWHGVTTDASGRVTGLSPRENQLSGRHPVVAEQTPHNPSGGWERLRR